MSNFIMDCGDKIFAEVTCAALKKRGVEWINFGDEATIQSHSKERCLIISSLTNSCDVNSDSFEVFLIGQFIIKKINYIIKKYSHNYCCC